MNVAIRTAKAWSGEYEYYNVVNESYYTNHYHLWMRKRLVYNTHLYFEEQNLTENKVKRSVDGSL